MKANKRTLRNVILFSFVAVVCGWVGVGVDKLLGQPSNLESLGALIFYLFPHLVYGFTSPFWWRWLERPAVET